MAIFALTDVVITINGVDLSDHITQASIETNAAELDTTTFGTNGWMSKIGGLKDWTLQIDFQSDFAAAEVDATIWPLLGETTEVVIKATSDAVSATNPSFTGDVLVNAYSPIAGSVGDLATTSASWPGAGELVRAES